MFHIIKIQGATNKNINVISPHTTETGTYQEEQKTIAGEDAGRKGPLWTAADSFD